MVEVCSYSTTIFSSHAPKILDDVFKNQIKNDNLSHEKIVGIKVTCRGDDGARLLSGEKMTIA